MKRFLAGIVLLFAFLSMLSLSATAVGTETHSLNELDLTVDLPSDYVVFTRDTSALDPNYSAYGLTKTQLDSILVENNVYLDAWDADVSFEVYVRMEYNIANFSSFSDSMRLDMGKQLMEGYGSIDDVFSEYHIYRHPQTRFLKLYSSKQAESGIIYNLQYYTVYEEKALNFCIASYSGQISDEEEAILKNMVDSVVFGTGPQEAAAEAAETDAFPYRDSDTHTTFTVPANWAEAEFSEERDILDAKFSSRKDLGVYIMYGSDDLWERMSSDERIGYTRSDIDNSMFTKAEIAEIYGVYTVEISMVTYNEAEYFKFFYAADTAASFSNTIKLMQLLRIDNGYMYTFQFTGTDISPYYPDFETLLNSVQYPQTAGQPASSATTIPVSVSNAGSDSSSLDYRAGVFIVSLIITILIYSVPIIIYRNMILKHPVDSGKAMRITVLYGIFALLVMTVLLFLLHGSAATGGAVIVWSFVNYRMLVKGGESSEQAMPSDMPEAEAAPDEQDVNAQNVRPEKGNPQTDSGEAQENGASTVSEADTDNELRYCHKCGNKLPPGSEFCPRCGSRIAGDKGDTAG